MERKWSPKAYFSLFSSVFGKLDMSPIFILGFYRGYKNSFYFLMFSFKAILIMILISQKILVATFL